MSVLLLILALLLPARPPELTATWEGQQVRIAWESDASQVCVYRETRQGARYFIGCWSGGTGEVVLPGPPPADWTHHPAAGDRFIGDFDGVRISSGALPWRIFLPEVKR